MVHNQPMISGVSIVTRKDVTALAILATRDKTLSFYFAVVTGWETENKYRVRNTLGQQVYFASERKTLLV